MSSETANVAESTEMPKSISEMICNDMYKSRDMEFMTHYLSHALKKSNHRKFLANLPPVVNKRVDALKKLQLDAIQMEAEFHRKVYELEKEYQDKQIPGFLKRKSIVVGDYEPTDFDANFAGNDDKVGVDSIDKAMKDLELNKPTIGIPEFWLAIFKYSPMFDSMVKEHDEPILKHLTDVTVTSKPLPDTSFILEFHFSENEFFKNKTLTKEYTLKYYPDANTPFTFDGPEIHKSSGCTIDWYDGKNVTEKIESSAEAETIFQDSFFNFFAPPQIPESGMFEDETINELLETDFEIGHCLKEHVIPRAVLYFSGATDDDDLSSEVSSNEEAAVSSDDDTIEYEPEVNAGGDAEKDAAFVV